MSKKAIQNGIVCFYAKSGKNIWVPKATTWCSFYNISEELLPFPKIIFVKFFFGKIHNSIGKSITCFYFYIILYVWPLFVWRKQKQRSIPLTITSSDEGVTRHCTLRAQAKIGHVEIDLCWDFSPNRLIPPCFRVKKALKNL